MLFCRASVHGVLSPGGHWPQNSHYYQLIEQGTWVCRWPKIRLPVPCTFNGFGPMAFKVFMLTLRRMFVYIIRVKQCLFDMKVHLIRQRIIQRIMKPLFTSVYIFKKLHAIKLLFYDDRLRKYLLR